MPPLRHEDLASAIGGSRESVTRALARLERAGLLAREHGWVMIPRESPLHPAFKSKV